MFDTYNICSANLIDFCNDFPTIKLTCALRSVFTNCMTIKEFCNRGRGLSAAI